MKDINYITDNVQTKEDFVEFITLLVKNFETDPASWENVTIKDYLEAIASWTEDMDGYYINQKLPVPEKIEWKVFANILMAAKIYE
ncbi:hypothetical protein FPZ43_13385 [Mucilaginibacter pallidiroseus]|uniref:DUF7660 domain-containing protein n=1 Tax=Mucilaginibacter pallidiroseus TaxID=2599295 RepID=A0A563U800_9SPHI|nr:hypothetical protein [Mucilaginibacter pallidiroseus]TWR27465.1 hypothetical protein FPZ43_13385 [Mucilaginibacter pallidiroseus]